MPFSKRILIDYPVPSAERYLGVSFPPVLYSALVEDTNFEVLDSGGRDQREIDVLVVISGGSHRSIRNMRFSSFSSKALVKEVYQRFDRLPFFLGRFCSLHRTRFYQHLAFRNYEYENRLKHLRARNPSLKIIHRLDGSYSNICKRYGYDQTVRKINQIADVTVHQSEYSRKVWETGVSTVFGKSVVLQPKRSIVIPNGVDTRLFGSYGSRIPLSGETKILHVSASPNPRKGLYKVLQLAGLLDGNVGIQFFLVGNQKNDPICGRDIEKFRNVHYLGPVNDRQQLSSIYRAADIFLFPSEKDCSPNVILEAMACGLPVITVDSGGNKELIQKSDLVGGLILDRKNPVLAVQNMIEHYERFQAGALEIVERYHKKEIMKKNYVDVIRELIDS